MKLFSFYVIIIATAAGSIFGSQSVISSPPAPYSVLLSLTHTRTHTHTAPTLHIHMNTSSFKMLIS